MGKMGAKATITQPETSALSSRVQTLEQWNNFVNILGVVLLALTFVIGIVSNRLNVFLNKAKNELASLEKIASDEKIAFANAIGESAKADAAKANSEAAIASDRAATAIKDAAEANDRAEVARTKAAVLEQKNLQNESKLEKERGKRLELEKALAPRQISINEFARYGGDKPVSNIDNLKLFSGVEVDIRCINDTEAIRTARNLVSVLAMAGWKIRDTGIDSDILDGINIGASIKADLQNDAATILAGFLQDNDIVATNYPFFDNVADTVIHIKIGFKPSPYFSHKKGLEFIDDLHTRGYDAPDIDDDANRRYLASMKRLVESILQRYKTSSR